MLHLITIVGNSAKNFYLEQKCISDFKSLMRTMTSGRVMIVSTKFRSDLFYTSEKANYESIMKLWALYTKTGLSSLDRQEISSSIGAKKSLTRYFQSINKIATNWHHYKVYKRAFYNSFSLDQENPVVKSVIGCDQFLIAHFNLKRTPLIDANERIYTTLTKDTFTIAMDILKNEALSN